MIKYIYERKEWPLFQWEESKIIALLSDVRFKQGRLLGRLESLGFRLQKEASLETLTLDVIKSSEIEGEKLPDDQVRSSIARRLGITLTAKVSSSGNVEGVVEMMLDATQKFNVTLTSERLWSWHASLFPAGENEKIRTGTWRDDGTRPMQVISGAMGKERVHYQAPKASQLKQEMKKFMDWFNEQYDIDPVLKAAVAHLWFVTIHPFDDGNGRIARTIADMQLARADGSRQRFYSMSAQIQRERNVYYDMLEKNQKGNLDITSWILWFLECLNRAIALAEKNLLSVTQKASFWETHRNVVLNERQQKMLNKLMDGLEGKLTTTKWAKMTKSSPDSALRDIQDLMEKRMLKKEEAGGRSTSYAVSY